MKPENHAIRQLEKQLEGAPPEVGAAIERMIASLNALILNRGDPAALAMCRKAMAIEVASFAELMLSQQKPND